MYRAMKRYYIFTMAIVFLLVGIGFILWQFSDSKAGAVLTGIALLTGTTASLMRPSNHRVGVLDFIADLAKKKTKFDN